MTLTAISPIDGRYADKNNELRLIFSEYGLMRYRLFVEIHWLLLLAKTDTIKEVPPLNPNSQKFLFNIYDNFSITDAKYIKSIEKTTNHDVKAIEYFLKEKIKGNVELEKISEFIHFACTSEDINNIAYALMLQEARTKCLLPLMDEIHHILTKFIKNYATLSMLCRTHGQPASPSTVGKEFANILSRLQRQQSQLKNLALYAKINGATGNYNAHYAAYPNIDWITLTQKFIQNLGLTWNPYTIQIEPHDYICEFSHIMIRYNNIMKDMDRDLWGYISLNYFKQKVVAQEVGSSTMPHKVNPIDFENSEGNLGISNALFDFFANQLPTSRWQRDLVDSTVLRNIGVAIGHALLAYQATLKGLNKLEINQDEITADLNKHWEVLGEAIQTVMRRYGITEPYETLKAFTRGKIITQDLIKDFIEQLEIPLEAKKYLRTLTPMNYIGKAHELATRILS